MNPTRSKSSCIMVFLFGKPAWELDLEGEEVDERMVLDLSKLGDELRERLHRTSRLTKTLLENGWSGSGGLYDISFYKDLAPEDARKELTALGISPDEVDIEEDDWSDDEE